MISSRRLVLVATVEGRAAPKPYQKVANGEKLEAAYAQYPFLLCFEIFSRKILRTWINHILNFSMDILQIQEVEYYCPMLTCNWKAALL